jgi:hypothetical protein
MGLNDLVLELMLQQQAQLDTVRKLDLENLLFHSLNGDPIEYSCPCGTRRGTDYEPRYSCKRPLHYVMRPKRCRSEKCNPSGLKNGASKDLSSVLNDIPSVKHCARRLRATTDYIKRGERWAQVLLSPVDATHLPGVVEAWCINCQDNTKIADGSSTFFDRSPRWTIGNKRSLYLERQPLCITCNEHGRGPRFVPVDPRIPSIFSQVLAGFVDNFKGYSLATQAHLLDMWPVSSRVSRLAQKSSQGAAKIQKKRLPPRVTENHFEKKLADGTRSKLL